MAQTHQISPERSEFTKKSAHRPKTTHIHQKSANRPKTDSTSPKISKTAHDGPKSPTKRPKTIENHQNGRKPPALWNIGGMVGWGHQWAGLCLLTRPRRQPWSLCPMSVNVAHEAMVRPAHSRLLAPIYLPLLLSPGYHPLLRRGRGVRCAMWVSNTRGGGVLCRLCYVMQRVKASMGRSLPPHKAPPTALESLANVNVNVAHEMNGLACALAPPGLPSTYP